MSGLLTRIRATSRPTRRAAALTAVLLVGLGFAATRLPLPLRAAAFAVSGRAVVALPDGRHLLVAQEHAVSVADASTGAVLTTVPLGPLVPGRGMVVLPGAPPRALMLAAAADGKPVSVIVDVSTPTVESVTALDGYAIDRAVGARPVGLDEDGEVVLDRMPDGTARAADERGLMWLSSSGIDAIPGSGDSRYEHLSFAPGGRLLYGVNDHQAVVCDITTGDIVADVGRSVGETDVMSPGATVLLAADGDHVVTRSPGESQVTVRTLGGGAVTAVEAGTPVRDIALSPDGATLYAVTDDRLLTIDVSRYT